MQDSQIITESVNGIILEMDTFLAEYKSLVENERVATFVLGQMVVEGANIAERWRGIFNNSVDECTANWNDLQAAIEQGVNAKEQHAMSIVANRTQRRHNRLDLKMSEFDRFYQHLLVMYEGRPQAYDTAEEFLTDLPVVNGELPQKVEDPADWPFVSSPPRHERIWEKIQRIMRGEA